MSEGAESKATQDGQDILQSSGLGQLMSILGAHLDPYNNLSSVTIIHTRLSKTNEC